MTLEDSENLCRHDFLGFVDYLADASADVAEILCKTASVVVFLHPVSYYYQPESDKLSAHFSKEAAAGDRQLCELLLRDSVGADRYDPQPLTDVEAFSGYWVKVGQSPAARRYSTHIRDLTEALKFAPSKANLTGEVRPIASTIASGILGAGLGYGGGWLAEKVLPDSVQTPGTLRKRLALMGGAGGVGIGALPGFLNLYLGKNFNDPSILSARPEDGFNGSLLGSQYLRGTERVAADLGSTLGSGLNRYTPIVPVNEVGEMLWGSGADPRLTAMTMGSIYGASQIPDPHATAGGVTPRQLGLFGTMMGAAGGGVKGYIVGSLVGEGLGVLTGLPDKAKTKLQQSGAALGILNSLVPRLFS